MIEINKKIEMWTNDSGEWICTNEAGELCAPTDRTVLVNLCAPGGRMPLSEANRLGLVNASEVEAKAEEPEVEQAIEPQEDKAVKPQKNKSK